MLENNDLLDNENEDSYVENLWRSFIENLTLNIICQIMSIIFCWNVIRFYGKNPWDSIQRILTFPTIVVSCIISYYFLKYIFYQVKVKLL